MDKSFGAVVFKKESVIKFLLVKHVSGNHWGFPKGHPIENEKPIETVKREVLEETNTIIKLIPMFSYSIQYVLPNGENKTVTFFLGEAIESGNHLIDQNEIVKVEWFNYTMALDTITFENSKTVLKKAWEYLEHKK